MRPYMLWLARVYAGDDTGGATRFDLHDELLVDYLDFGSQNVRYWWEARLVSP